MSQKILLASVSQGLANRLRSLATLLRLAELSGRELRLHWPQGAECPAEFSELFENQIPLYEKGSLCPGKEYFLRPLLQESDDGWRHELIKKTAGGAETVLRGFDFLDDDEPVIEVTSHLINREHPCRAGDLSPGCFARLVLPHYLDQLRPRKDIRDAANEFSEKNYSGTVFGVHVRRTDFHTFLQPPSVEEFCVRMRYWIQKIPDVRFYLAADEAETRDVFSERFPGRILLYPKTYYTGQLRQTDVREALIDLLLLCRTSRLIGTGRSSFSVLSAAWGKVEADYLFSGGKIAQSSLSGDEEMFFY